MAYNPSVFVDGVMNGFSLHIEPSRIASTNVSSINELQPEPSELRCEQCILQLSKCNVLNFVVVFIQQIL